MLWEGGDWSRDALRVLEEFSKLSEVGNEIHQPDLVGVGGIQGADPLWQGQGLEFRAGLTCGSGEESQSELGAPQFANEPLRASTACWSPELSKCFLNSSNVELFSLSLKFSVRKKKKKKSHL